MESISKELKKQHIMHQTVIHHSKEECPNWIEINDDFYSFCNCWSVTADKLAQHKATCEAILKKVDEINDCISLLMDEKSINKKLLVLNYEIKELKKWLKKEIEASE